MIFSFIFCINFSIICWTEVCNFLIVTFSFIKSRLDAFGASQDVGMSDEIIDFCAANGKWFLTVSTLENNNTDILDAMHDFLER